MMELLHRLPLKQLKRKKWLFRLISVLLVIVLIFCGCGFHGALTCHAVVAEIVLTAAGVTLVAALLLSVGVGVNASNATTVCNDFVNSCDDDVSSQIVTQSSLLTSAGMLFEATGAWWSSFFNSVIKYFGTQAVTDSLTSIDMTSDSVVDFLRGTSKVFLPDTAVNTNSHLSVTCGNTVASWYGYSYAKSVFSDSVISHFFSNGVVTSGYFLSGLSVFDCGNGIRIVTNLSSTNVKNVTSVWLRYGLPSNNTFTVNDTSVFESYLKTLIIVNGSVLCPVGGTLKYLDGSTAVSGRFVGGLQLPDTVCDADGIISWGSFFPWALGDDIPSVKVDADCYPGIDTWCDDAAAADSTSISVPGELDKVTDGTLTTADVRDISTTDVDTDTGTDTEDKDQDKNKPVVPSLSLPEIIFKEKFPFCLPWDIYNLFVGFQGDGEAPKWEVPFKFENLGIDETITIDMSQFDEPVKIIRFFLGAGFVLALILISRKMIGSE